MFIKHVVLYVFVDSYRKQNTVKTSKECVRCGSASLTGLRGNPQVYKWENLKTALSGLMFTCVCQKNREGKGKLNVKFQTVAMKRSMIMGQHNTCVHAYVII